MGGRTYTRAELRRLRRGYTAGESVRSIAAALGRDPKAVKQKAVKMKLQRPPKASAEERTRRILAEYPSTPSIADLAAALGITPGSLKAHAWRLGVKRLPEAERPARVRGGQQSVVVRRRKAALLATPLDAAWRGLIPQQFTQD